MSTPWAFIESEVYSRIGALLASNPAGAEANYAAIPKTSASIDDSAFNLAAVRVAIVDVTIEVVAFLCHTEGDLRRNAFFQSVFGASGSFLPTLLGPLLAFTDQATNRPLVERPLSDVLEYRANPSLFTEPVFYYATLGSRFFHTLAGNAEVTFCDYIRPYTTYAQLAALFDNTNDLFPLPDEFAVIVADGAAGRLCLKAGSMVAEGRAFLEAYYTALKERGVNVQQVIFPAQPAS